MSFFPSKIRQSVLWLQSVYQTSSSQFSFLFPYTPYPSTVFCWSHCLCRGEAKKIGTGREKKTAKWKFLRKAGNKEYYKNPEERKMNWLECQRKGTSNSAEYHCRTFQDQNRSQQKKREEWTMKKKRNCKVWKITRHTPTFCRETRGYPRRTTVMVQVLHLQKLKPWIHCRTQE